MGLSANQNTFIKKANEHFSEMYAPLHELYNDSTRIDLFNTLSAIMSRSFALARIDKTLSESSSESSGIARGIMGFYYLHEFKDAEKNKAALATKVKDLKTTIDFFNNIDSAKSLFNQLSLIWQNASDQQLIYWTVLKMAYLT